jgi:hypothetical protein
MPKGEKSVESLGITSHDTSLAFVFPWFLSGLCPFAFYLPFYLSNSVEPYRVWTSVYFNYALCTLCLCLDMPMLAILLSIHDIILSIPCLVHTDGGGAPYNLNLALCIPKANSTMCICYGGALSLFISYHALFLL